MTLRRKQIVFQSTPLVVEGRSPSVIPVLSRFVGSFNPRPSLSRGEARQAIQARWPRAVSIHAPRCRGAKPAGLHATGDVLVFQSTPLVVEGRSRLGYLSATTCSQFQSTPLVVEGRSRCCGSEAKRISSFNPRPSLSRGEAALSVVAARQRFLVSIHAPRCRGAKRGYPWCGQPLVLFQSTPLVVEGRSLRCIPIAGRSAYVSIHAPRCRGAKHPAPHGH